MIDTVVNVINSLICASLILFIASTFADHIVPAAIFGVITLAASIVGSVINLFR